MADPELSPDESISTAGCTRGKMHTLFPGRSAPVHESGQPVARFEKRPRRAPFPPGFPIDFPLPRRMALVVNRLGPPRLNLETVRECSVVSPKFEMCPRRGAKTFQRFTGRFPTRR